MPGSWYDSSPASSGGGPHGAPSGARNHRGVSDPDPKGEPGTIGLLRRHDGLAVWLYAYELPCSLLVNTRFGKVQTTMIPNLCFSALLKEGFCRRRPKKKNSGPRITMIAFSDAICPMIGDQ